MRILKSFTEFELGISTEAKKWLGYFVYIMNYMGCKKVVPLTFPKETSKLIVRTFAF